MPKYKKLYCYVDESGQDTKGELFLVSMVVAENEHDWLRERLEKIEKLSGKGRRKWMKSRPAQKTSYIQEVLNIPDLANKLCYAIYRHTTDDYLSSTVLATAQAIKTYITGDYKAVIFVDGLPQSLVPWFGTELRHLRIKAEKVRGMRREEADAIMRLADALCGFVREALEGHNKELIKLFEQGTEKGYLKSV